jgi:hypothetical protein
MDKKEKNMWLSNRRRAEEYKKSNLQYSVNGGKVGRRGSNSKARHTPVWLKDGDSVITEKQQRAIRKKGIKLPKNKLPIQKGSAPRGGRGTKALLLPNEIVLTSAQARSIEQQGGKLPTWGLQSTAGPIKKRGDKGGRCRCRKKRKKKSK